MGESTVAAAAPTETTKGSVGSSKMMWFKAPPAVYFGRGGTQEALRDLEEAKIQRVFLVSDRNIHAEGYLKIVTERLDELEMDIEVFADVVRPTEETVAHVTSAMQVFRPDCIIAVGGGSVMDVAKVCRIIYDPSNPHSRLSDLFAYDHMQLLSDREEATGVSRLPPADKHIKKLVCIPTTSGTGSEMTPVAWVVEEESEEKKLALKRPIISWRMTPDIAINDGYFTAALSKTLAASGGLNALTCALESAVSRLSNDYTFALSAKGAKLLYDHLPSSVENADQESRGHCHNGASIAGMAAANAFVGIAHALSFVLQRFFALRPAKKMNQGYCSALVLSHVVKFNAERSPAAAQKYAYIAEQLKVVELDDGDEADRVKKAIKLAEGIEELKKKVGADATIRDCGVTQEEFDNHVDTLAEETLKVIGCAATNPVDVSLSDAKGLLQRAFAG